MRLTGLATGLDTDQIIQNLGRVHTMRIDTVKRERQLAMWRQESLRTVINSVNDFMRSNLNLANPTNNFRSANAFARFSYDVAMNGLKTQDARDAAANVVSVTANGDIKSFNHTVQAVTQMATRDTWTGETMGLRGVTGDGFDIDKFVDNRGNALYTAFGVSIDGVSRTVMISNTTVAGILNEHGTKPEQITESNVLGGFYANISTAGYTDIDDLGELENKYLGFSTGSVLEYVSIADYVRSYVDKEGGLGEFASLEDAITAAFEDIADKYGDSDAADTTSALSVVPVFNKVTNNAAAAQAFADVINSQVTTLFGRDFTDIVSVNDDGELSFHKASSNITIFALDGMADSLVRLGFPEGGASNTSVHNRSMSELLGADFDRLFDGPNSNVADIHINGVTITISRDETISSLTSKINNSNAGVTLSYNSASDRFTLTSNADGTAANISRLSSEAALLLGALKLGDVVEMETRVGNEWRDGAYRLAINGEIVGDIFLAGDTDTPRTGEVRIKGGVDLDDLNLPGQGSRTEGQNLIAMINGETFVRQSNTFTFEGVTYTFNGTFNTEFYERDVDGRIGLKPGVQQSDVQDIRIQVNKNTADIIDGVKSFVEEYNKILTQINELLNQKRDRDFRPLSEDEKKAMSEDDRKAYEEKAMLGILANDSDLRRLQDQLRSAIYMPVAGVSLTMSDIGITTSPSWKDGGLLVVNEDKLKTALENNYDQVVAMFTKTSDIPYGDLAGRGQRMSEIGVAQRINDIMNDAVRTSRDANNNKGYLIEKAGVQNDASMLDNTIQRQINNHDDRISKLLDRWYRQENSLYAMFARMETMMMRMQAQQNSLASLMAQSG
ncbi:MAG: flagellar filament capping protein FliD [Chitinispirillales bacterium]|nr:flagellar filament capping protein FliD [Chitinispirillales bacterium]